MTDKSNTITHGDFEWQETDETFGNSVMIRARVARGPVMYAVFDDGEKVSDDYGPLNDVECISFAEGYANGKQDYQ